MEAEQALPEILTSLRLLGSPDPGLGAALGQPDVAPIVDNLRGTFADVAELIPTLVVEEYISPRQAAAIQAVYHALGSVPVGPNGHPDADGAPNTGDTWERVRHAALRALDEMNALTPTRLRTTCPD